MPTKATWIELEENPDLEFEFFLADRLGLLVGEMRQRMEQREFVRWAMFHSRKAQRQELAMKAAK